MRTLHGLQFMLGAALVSAALLAGMAPQHALAQAAPEPRILVIDRNALLQLSSAGKAMMAGVDALSIQADTEFQAEAQALQQEAQQLQQQLAILAPEAQEQRRQEFMTKQQDLQQRAQLRQSQIQGGLGQAGQQLDQALQPILQQIMTERGANMVLDRTSVIVSSVDIDITATAVERLDQVLPTVTVQLVNPPAPAPQ